MAGAESAELAFDVSRAMARWEKEDFYETLEADMKSPANAAVLRECLRRVCQHGGEVEQMSDLIVHSAYDISGVVWATVRMDVVEAVPAPGGPAQKHPGRGILNLSIDKTTGKGTVTGCNAGDAE